MFSHIQRVFHKFRLHFYFFSIFAVFNNREILTIPESNFFLQVHEILEYLDQESQALWIHLEIFLDMYNNKKNFI